LTQYFGSDGPNAYEAGLVVEGEALVWTMLSARDRFTGTFNDERNAIRATGRRSTTTRSGSPGWTSP
jgi:hypothetical protein